MGFADRIVEILAINAAINLQRMVGLQEEMLHSITDKALERYLRQPVTANRKARRAAKRRNKVE